MLKNVNLENLNFLTHYNIEVLNIFSRYHNIINSTEFANIVRKI